MKIAIVGCGVTGLAAAVMLSRKGHETILIERDDKIGGIAKTLEEDEGFRFDTGPHILSIKRKPKVRSFIESLLGDDLITIPYTSGVMILGRFYDWPLQFSQIMKLPLMIKIRAAHDILTNPFSKKLPEKSLREYIINTYGNTLFEIDFEPYTRKVLKVDDVSCLEADWLKGARQILAPKKNYMNSLFSLAKGIIFPVKSDDRFYPRYGIGQLSEKMRGELKKNKNSRVFTGTVIDEIRTIDGKARSVTLSDSSTHDIDAIIWTAPMVSLAPILGIQAPDLHFVNIVQYNLKINRPYTHIRHGWCCIVDQRYMINRITSLSFFSKDLMPKGKSSLMAEVTANDDDPVWKDPESKKEDVIEELVSMGYILDRSDVTGVSITMMKEVYPKYLLGYKQRKDNFIQEIKNKASNIFLAGRAGLFWYSNIDHSIENAEEVKDEVLKLSSSD